MCVSPSAYSVCVYSHPINRSFCRRSRRRPLAQRLRFGKMSEPNRDGRGKLARAGRILYTESPIGWNFIQPVGVSVFASINIRRTAIAPGGSENEAEIDRYTNRDLGVRYGGRRRRLRSRKRACAGGRGY